MTNKQAHNIECIRPDWDVPAAVKVYSTTRVGGVSAAPYDTLNMGLHVGDDQQHVLKNRARVLKAIDAPGNPLWLNQVHGRDVAFIDCLPRPDGALDADGTFTRESGQVLSVGTADCLPVVLANAQGTAVAVVHAGWRGLADGVLQSAMAHFSESDELHAWLGPAIGPTAFEVGIDVVDRFLVRDKKNASAFKPAGGGKFMADLYALARMDLNRQRPIVVTGGEHCTYAEPALFHSYRRDGKASGRMATFAWIE